MFTKPCHAAIALACAVVVTALTAAKPAAAMENATPGSSCLPQAGYQYTLIECGQPASLAVERLRYHLSSNLQDASNCGTGELPEFHVGAFTLHPGGVFGTAAAYLIAETQHRLTHRHCGTLKY